MTSNEQDIDSLLRHQLSLSSQQHRTEFQRNEKTRDHSVRRQLMRNEILRTVEKFIMDSFKKAGQVNYNKNHVLLAILKKKSNRIAKAIECKLYSDAASFEAYNDRTTLIPRIKNALSESSKKNKVKNKPLNNEKLLFNSYAKRRHMILKSRIGNDLYEEISCICAKIKNIRRSDQKWKNMLHNTSESIEHTVSEKLPLHITKLYLDTKLVRAYDRVGANTSVPDLECITDPDWKALLAEAQSYLNSFDKGENKIVEKNTPG